MKRYFTQLMMISIIFTACETKSNESEIENKVEIVEDELSAKETIDVIGTYKSILPCSDCEGIETEIILSSDEMYQMKSKHLGESEEILKEFGEYYWSENGNILILEGIDTEPISYEVKEGELIQLQKNGEKTTRKHEKSYVLKKE